MYIFWKIDIFGLSDDDNDTTRHDTETPDPGQPPLPGTKYPARVSPHFDLKKEKEKTKKIAPCMRSAGSGLWK